ncbi:MAG: DUF805 domain-containing protein [Pseudomonadota bacterium]
MSIFSLLFSFHGRINRMLYWLASGSLLLLIWLLITLQLRELVLIPFISLVLLQVRRCRDIGWSPWLALIALVPVIQIIFMVIVGIPKSRYPYQGYGFAGTRREALKDSRFRVIQCANCQTKIRVAFPPPAGVGKCPLCHHRFLLKADEYGNMTLYAQDNAISRESALNEITTAEQACRVLGVENGANQVLIRKAYKEKMSQYHPDKVSQLGIEIRELADQKSKQINRAYRFLIQSL